MSAELLESAVNCELDTEIFAEPLRAPLGSAVAVEDVSPTERVAEDVADVKGLPRAGDESGEGTGCIHPACLRNGKCSITCI